MTEIEKLILNNQRALMVALNLLLQDRKDLKSSKTNRERINNAQMALDLCERSTADIIDKNDQIAHSMIEGYIVERAKRFIECVDNGKKYPSDIAHWYRGETEFNGKDHHGLVIEARCHAEGREAPDDLWSEDTETEEDIDDDHIEK